MNEIKFPSKAKWLGIAIFIICFSILVVIITIPPKASGENKVAHISFDDVYDVFIDLTINEDRYESVFENKFLGFLREMHQIHGAKFVLYVYERYPEYNYNLMSTTDRFRHEFIENSNWLKIGYHSIEPTTSFDSLTSLDKFTDSFTLVNNEIERFAGKEAIANVLRLNYFRGNEEKIKYLHSQGILGLLCSDDNRNSYNLTELQHLELKQKDLINIEGMSYYNTDARFDKKRFIYFDMLRLRNNEIIVLFGHEWALNSNMYNQISIAIKWLHNNNYKFSFLEENIY